MLKILTSNIEAVTELASPNHDITNISIIAWIRLPQDGCAIFLKKGCDFSATQSQSFRLRDVAERRTWDERWFHRETGDQWDGHQLNGLWHAFNEFSTIFIDEVLESGDWYWRDVVPATERCWNWNRWEKIASVLGSFTGRHLAKGVFILEFTCTEINANQCTSPINQHCSLYACWL